MSSQNPCLTCGACCAFYRASFYWTEGDDVTPGGVPVDMTEKMNDFRRVMKGTNTNRPRCIALLGIIGGQVSCAIYDKRASICREFEVSWENGNHNERCDKARQFYGLEPINPETWDGPGDLPHAA